jgi:chitin disaccharide deacetylase
VTAGIHLIVQADDYGMCPPVTDGVLAAFRQGVVTQASIMPPAPDAPRAAWLAQRAGLPLGIHFTLMCEWNGLRYYPLTPAPTLRDHDGAFPAGVTELRALAAQDDVRAELRAQLAAVRTTGIEPTHFESHVGVYDPDLLAEISAESGLPCRDAITDPRRAMPIDSLWHLSVQPPTDKLEALLGYVESLRPGVHMIVAHPALDDPLLRTLCEPTSRRWKWARDIRLTDLEALTDPLFARVCAAHGVRLTSLRGLAPTDKSGTK